MATSFWILLGGAALTLFWAVGAYNRLIGLRDRVVRRHGEADRVLRARREAVLAWVAVAQDIHAVVGDTASLGLGPLDPVGLADGTISRHGGLEPAPTPGAMTALPDSETVALVVHACAQAAAVAEQALERPTRRGALASLNMAEQVLERTLRAFMDDPAATATPQALRRRASWMACEVQLTVARQVLNREIAAYNAAVTQLPARLLATLVGMRPTVRLQAGAELSPTVGRRPDRADRPSGALHGAAAASGPASGPVSGWGPESVAASAIGSPRASDPPPRPPRAEQTPTHPAPRAVPAPLP